jgi:hypothetical protein
VTPLEMRYKIALLNGWGWYSLSDRQERMLSFQHKDAPKNRAWVPTELNADELAHINDYMYDAVRGHVPDYPTTWDAAGLLLDTMRSQGAEPELYVDSHNENKWVCRLAANSEVSLFFSDETAPIAICLAYIAWKEQCKS